MIPEKELIVRPQSRTNIVRHTPSSQVNDPVTTNCRKRAISPALLLSLTLWALNTLGLNQADRDGLPIVDTKGWAYNVDLKSPPYQTTLEVVAHQADQSSNPLTYRWVKVSGPPSGKVAFSPNGNEDANITTARFSGEVAGNYTLRVIISDGRKDSISEVQVSINPELSVDRSGDSNFRAERHGGRTIYSRVDRVIVRFNAEGSFQWS